MKILKNIFRIALLILTLNSCGQTKNVKQIETEIPKNQSEKNITKLITDSTNKLSNKVEKLELEYTVWGCVCPQWIKSDDNYNSDSTKNYYNLHFYIEPKEDELELPIYFDAFRHRIKLKGSFYEKEDYPKGSVEGEEPMPKAKVFQYTEIKVIDKPNYEPNTKIETLILEYNAIACTCAKWSETKYSNSKDKKNYLWLEPANEKLIQADTLFNGEKLPIQIKITGQIVSENGFPKRELLKVGQDEAGKVFRYTKIEVLKK